MLQNGNRGVGLLNLVAPQNRIAEKRYDGFLARDVAEIEFKVSGRKLFGKAPRLWAPETEGNIGEKQQQERNRIGKPPTSPADVALHQSEIGINEM